ncbi:restriction endonuclease subunit S [Methanosarcina sp. DH1]|uniref:restriction endonuclease subunit S n=1 Tax=Methanosarcina sp. DH1 TaxID=2605695 RepID=UPI001E461E60|nr:restriction endonuclease subunit S [Methanosarcina sp. DH1]MCC4767384.1 restriction endonuclease subunit S [Methanosarcina sp. DH1]
MNEVQTISLGEIMAKKSGSVDPSKFPDEVFDLYSIPAFDSRKPEVVAGKLIGSTKQIVEPGDVLLSKIVPHIRRSWVVGEAQGRRIIASGEWIVFRSEIIYSNYLRHVLVSDPFHSKFMSTVSGVGGSLLRARPAFVEKIKIPLPPLPEQQRIADILDRAEALRTKRRASLAHLDELTQSIFYDMFGDSVSNPMGWKRCPLKHCVDHIQIGPFGSLLHKEDYVFGGIPLINPTHIEYGKIVPDLNQSITVQKHAELQLYQLQQGDVIMGRRGEMGRCAIVGSEHNGMLCGTGSLFIRPDESKATAIYLQATLSSATMRKHLEGFSLGATLPNLNRGIVGELAVSLPPIELQHEYAQRVATVGKIKAAHKASLAELDELFTSLQYRAFRGEL